MNQAFHAVLLTVGLSLFAVIGDYFLKVAGYSATPYRTKSFLIGLLFYAISAFGAVYVLKHVKLATVGVVYCVSMVLLLTAVGVIFFKESLNGTEVLGILLALAALVLLGRYATG